MKFNMSKQAISKRKELQERYYDKVLLIVDEIMVYNLYKKELDNLGILLNNCFLDLYINCNEESTIEYLDIIEKVLLGDNIQKILKHPEQLALDVINVFTDDFKDVFNRNEFTMIANEYKTFANNKFELKMVMDILNRNTIKSVSTLVEQKVEDEVNSLYNHFNSLAEFRAKLYDEIYNVFKLDDDEIEEQEEIQVTEQWLNLYSFRELEKLVIDKGYKLNRVRGSHHIYTKDGCKPIVIPKHTTDIGKCLSIKIQKDAREE